MQPSDGASTRGVDVGEVEVRRRWDWYAAYMTARESGSTPEEASAAAGRYMAEVKHIQPAL